MKIIFDLTDLPDGLRKRCQKAIPSLKDYQFLSTAAKHLYEDGEKPLAQEVSVIHKQLKERYKIVDYTNEEIYATIKEQNK